MSQAEANARERVDKALKFQDILFKVLNDFHGTNFSQRFWKILLLGFVYKHVIDEYRTELKNQVATTVTAKRKRRLIAKLKEKAVTLINRFKDYRNSRRFIQSLQNTDLIIGGYLDVLQEQKGITKVDVFDSIQFNKATYSIDKRTTLLNHRLIQDSHDPSSFTRLIKKLPSCFVENFQECFNATIKLKSPINLHMALHLNSNYLKFFVAVNREANLLKLNKYQHGSHYGEMLFMDFVETEISDKFHTWGWKMAENHIPDYAYRLEGFRQNYQRATRQVNSVEFDLVIFLGASDPLSKDIFREKLDMLLLSVNRELYNRILVRPRPVSRIALDNYYDDIVTKHKVERDKFTRKPFQSIAISELVIHLSCPSTTMYECIYVEKPFMGLLNDNNRPSYLVKPYYQFLIENNTLHNDLGSLISFLNSGNVKQKLSSTKKHNTFQSFRHTFARDFNKESVAI